MEYNAFIKNKIDELNRLNPGLNNIETMKIAIEAWNILQLSKAQDEEQIQGNSKYPQNTSGYIYLLKMFPNNPKANV